MSNDSNYNHQNQEAKTNKGNVLQVGRDYTQTTNTKISVWISVIFVAILAIGASVMLRLNGKVPGLGIDITPETSTPQSPK
ncbi:hypothetical protein ACEYW6_11880 [Nostoc sp. UIC 10607]|uniref:hypothetical protein n=1 Tax=Nostoc sp. UIC 10607 TaxID=3045935 RepID=UPI0039A2E2A9